MDTLISNIGQLVTPIESALDELGGRYALQVTNDTQLLISNGRIETGSRRRVPTKCQIVDAGHGVVIPGLIDPFWTMPALPSWIDEVTESRFPSKDLLGWSSRIIRRALRSGVTSIEVKCPHDSAFDGLAALGYLARHSQMRVIGSLLASLPEDSTERDQTVSLLIGEVIPEIRQRGLATFCDIGWDNHVGFIAEARTVLRAASGAGLRPKLHLGSAPNMEDIAKLAHSLDVASVGCASHLSREMVRSLSSSHVVPVYLPGLRTSQPVDSIDVRELIDQGLPIAIGSGSGLPKCTTRSMWSVLASAMDRMDLALPEAIVACTLNNAMALDKPHETGSLEHGKSADLILLDLVDYREIETALDCPPVAMVMVNGEIVHST